MVTEIQFDYPHPEIDSRIIDAFQLEVDFIEIEFRTIIHYEIIHHKHENKVALNLKHHQQSISYDNPAVSEIILFKLETFLKVILDSHHY